MKTVDEKGPAGLEAAEPVAQVDRLAALQSEECFNQRAVDHVTAQLCGRAGKKLMTMRIIDSYPEFAPEIEKQTSPAPETLDLAVQPPAERSLAPLRSLVVDSVSAPNSKRAYSRAVDNFLAWHQREDRGLFSKAPATINVHLSALRRLAAEAADNGLLDPDIAAGIAKVKGASGHGVRTGNWLTKEQAETILRLPNVATLKGKRDRAPDPRP